MKYDHVQCATSTFRRARDGVVDARDGVPDRVRDRGATRVVVVVVVVVVARVIVILARIVVDDCGPTAECDHLEKMGMGWSFGYRV